MHKRQRFIITAGLFLLASFVWAGGASEKTGSKTLNIAALNGSSGVGMVKIFSDKPDLGSDVTALYEVVMAPDVMMAKLLEGTVDIAALPVNMPAILAAKGAPYILGAVTGYGLIYTVTSDPEIQSLKDLRGKRLFTISPNTTPDILTRHLLQENGLVPDEDVILDFSYGHTELAQALIAGLVETASLPEPFITMVTMKNPELRVAIDYQEEFRKLHDGTNYPITAIAVRRDLAEEYPEVLERFFTAYDESIEWVKAHPKDAGILVAEQGFTLPPSVTSAAIPRLNLQYVSAVEIRPALESLYTVLADVNPGTIGGKLPGDDFYFSPKSSD